MKEIKITEWIYKSKSDKDKSYFRVPVDAKSKFPKGIYLIKIYRLESED